MKRYKYPRTPHLPWSPGVSDDDIKLNTASFFEGKEVVVTEKMDGENTSIYSDYMHARSIDSRFHPSRTWVKALQAEIGYRIPAGWRICGENLYAQHSIAYADLESYFLAFSVWNNKNVCLSWDETIRFVHGLNLDTPRVLYQGIWDEKRIRGIELDLDKQEGYVVRIADQFPYQAFTQCVSKWVRKDHVQSDEHWMHKRIILNALRRSGHEG